MREGVKQANYLQWRSRISLMRSSMEEISWSSGLKLQQLENHIALAMGHAIEEYMHRTQQELSWQHFHALRRLHFPWHIGLIYAPKWAFYHALGLMGIGLARVACADCGSKRFWTRLALVELKKWHEFFVWSLLINKVHNYPIFQR